MPFVETEASVRYEIIDGKRIPVITPKTEVTLTIQKQVKNISQMLKLCRMSKNNTSTKSEHIRRDVKVTVESIPLGTATNISD